MSNPFQQAARRATGPKKSGSKDNFVQVDDEDVSAAIDAYIEAKEREKQANSDAKLASAKISDWARPTWIKIFLDKDRKPETLKFVSHAGSQVTWVVQNRSYPVSDEQESFMRGIVGDSTFEDITTTETSFSFNSDVLRKRGVVKHLGNRLGEVIQELVDNGTLSQEDADNLLVAEQKKVFREPLVDNLHEICERDPETMEHVLTGMNQITCYPKA